MRVSVFIAIALAVCAHGSDIQQALQKAHALYMQGDLQGAEALLSVYLADKEANALEAAVALTDLAVIQQDTGRTRQAERTYRKALDLIDKVDDASAANTLRMRTSGNLASLYLESDRPGKAERILRQINVADLPTTEDAARIKGTLASLHMVRGRLKEAEELFGSALEYWRANGKDADAAIVLNNLAVIAMDRDGPAKALRPLEQALELWKKVGVLHHPLALRTMVNYGFSLLHCGQAERAKPVLEEAMQIASKWFGADAVVTSRVSSVYAAMLEATGRRKEARAILSEIRRNAAFEPGRHTVDILDLQAPRR